MLCYNRTCGSCRQFGLNGWCKHCTGHSWSYQIRDTLVCEDSEAMCHPMSLCQKVTSERLKMAWRSASLSPGIRCKLWASSALNHWYRKMSSSFVEPLPDNLSALESSSPPRFDVREPPTAKPWKQLSPTRMSKVCCSSGVVFLDPLAGFERLPTLDMDIVELSLRLPPIMTAFLKIGIGASFANSPASSASKMVLMYFVVMPNDADACTSIFV
mmetsp:Transcript_41955/g.98429  ORF Transcript_41955/g.98429 Transcript_41955/m.98429 type:complete len:214 (-) Transcript_41955:2574-3215(-)